MTNAQARKLAYQMAREAGLDTDTAAAVRDSYAGIHHEEFTDREVRDFIRQEIQQHANP